MCQVLCWSLASAMVVAAAVACSCCLRRARTLRALLEEEKGASIRTLRHDLLSPLNAVGGYLELLAESSGTWDASARSHLTKARAAFERTLEVLAGQNK